jgi:hypothetical protein
MVSSRRSRAKARPSGQARYSSSFAGSLAPLSTFEPLSNRSSQPEVNSRLLTDKIFNKRENDGWVNEKQLSIILASRLVRQFEIMV